MIWNHIALAIDFSCLVYQMSLCCFRQNPRKFYCHGNKVLDERTVRHPHLSIMIRSSLSSVIPIRAAQPPLAMLGTLEGV